MADSDSKPSIYTFVLALWTGAILLYINNGTTCVHMLMFLQNGYVCVLKDTVDVNLLLDKNLTC